MEAMLDTGVAIFNPIGYLYIGLIKMYSFCRLHGQEAIAICINRLWFYVILAWH